MTLIDDLETAAEFYEDAAKSGVAVFEPRVFAARLREAARRLREEMAAMERNQGHCQCANEVSFVLNRINAGPLTSEDKP